jgi:hypothetical protein
MRSFISAKREGDLEGAVAEVEMTPALTPHLFCYGDEEMLRCV